MKSLELFIKKFGITGNLPELYEDVVNDICQLFPAIEIHCPYTPQEAIIKKKTYCYEIRQSGRYFFTLPKIVMEDSFDYQGYFIIDGIERFMLIQEVLRKNCYMLTNDGSKFVCSVRLFFRTIEIYIENCEFYIQYAD